MLYDVFICHASEDKDGFVRSLAKRLKKHHIEVWYDEFSLMTGDSIRRAIDRGLSQSRYGIVVLSRNFFNKGWSSWELDGLVQRENLAKTKILLPIWYEVSRDDVFSYSPSLADKKAILASKGSRHVLSELLKVIKPEGSTLLIARDRVIKMGFEPPVVTDDWWLDVAEFSGSNYYWERWGYPLPDWGDTPYERGERLAWAALEMMWQDTVNDARISQITHPKEVLQFINSQPGLAEVCHKYPDYLVAYAPQLTIRGFGGEFENELEELYEKSILACQASASHSELTQRTRGIALTTDGSSPACDEIWALRHPNFGNYKPSHISCNYVQGELMGLTVKVYATIDYIVWFLSEQSSWMPERIHKFLLEGLKKWPVWCWYSGTTVYEHEFKPNQSTGALFGAMVDAKTFDKFSLTRVCLDDIKTRFDYTVNLLGLSETAETLAQRFIRSGFIENWFKEK